MTAERSSENNDGHQNHAKIGLAGGCALQRRSVRHHEPVPGSLAARTSILAIAGDSAGQGFIRHQRRRDPPRKMGVASGIVRHRDSAGSPKASSVARGGWVPLSMVC